MTPIDQQSTAWLYGCLLRTSGAGKIEILINYVIKFHDSAHQ